MKTEACSQPSPALSLNALVSGFSVSPNIPDLSVSGLQLDSRKIRPGDVFIALNGHHDHGLRYQLQAVQNGCVAILYDPEGALELVNAANHGLPLVPVDGLSEKLGYIADRFFSQPSLALDVIAITGTNGKTSCSHFLAEAMNPTRKSGVIGTLGWGTPGQLSVTSHTTPDAVEAHRLLATLRSEGYQMAFMEASSHGLIQGRLNGIHFKGALFTNISRDHLDYHETMAAYLEAKLRLLEWPELEFVVLNVADPIAAPILSRKVQGKKYIGFGPEGHSCSTNTPVVTFSSVLQNNKGIEFTVKFAGFESRVTAPVFGDFNVENLTATLAVLIGAGMPFSEAIQAMSGVAAVPGRMEQLSKDNRTVVIDFAHTPDALVSALASVRKHCSGNLWVIFGCGGDRDRGKRSEMGKVADQMADRIVVTDDNPRTENPDDIINDILSGIVQHDALVIRDRRNAIEHVLERVAPDDLVLLAGKGHENYQEIQGVKHPFSDREQVLDILGRL